MPTRKKTPTTPASVESEEVLVSPAADVPASAALTSLQKLQKINTVAIDQLITRLASLTEVIATLQQEVNAVCKTMVSPDSSQGVSYADLDAMERKLSARVGHALDIVMGAQGPSTSGISSQFENMPVT
jgi:hypothetical protein